MEMPSRGAQQRHTVPTRTQSCLPLGARMRCVVGLGQMLPVEPRVDLCRRYVGVPQQLLNRSQIATGLQQVGCERVPQNVWMHVNAQSQFARASCESALHAPCRQPAAARRDEQRARIAALSLMYARRATRPALRAPGPRSAPNASCRPCRAPSPRCFRGRSSCANVPRQVRRRSAANRATAAPPGAGRSSTAVRPARDHGQRSSHPHLRARPGEPPGPLSALWAAACPGAGPGCLPSDCSPDHGARRAR